MEQLEKPHWDKTLTVTFVGEEGVDIGGLRRQLLTSFFKEKKMFQLGNLVTVSTMLQMEQYKLAGQLCAYGLICGHPGPKIFNKNVVDFIVEDKVNPTVDFVFLDLETLQIIKQIEAAEEDQIDDLREELHDVFTVARFTKPFTSATKGDAIKAVVQHSGWYSRLGALLQFREGLQLHGILALLREYPVEAGQMLQLSTEHTAAAEVKKFYNPVLSEAGSNKRLLENRVLYNFHSFLMKVEEGDITTTRYDMDSDAEVTCVMDMSLVLEALVGCEAIPTDLDSGLIHFEHDDIHHSKVNTCAPSVTFSNLNVIKNPASFKECMLNIIIGAKGFGIA